MSKIILLFISLFYLTVVMDLEVSAQTDSSLAKVYFMRLPRREQESLLELAMNYCNVFIDSNFICKLDEKKYFTTLVPAGMHRFDMQILGKKIKERSESISLELEAGKSYYVQFFFNRYATKYNDSYCKFLTEERANMMLPDLKEDKSCYKDVNGKSRQSNK